MFEYIDEGISRMVYELNDNMVIKVAKFQHEDDGWGIRQCKHELEIYSKYKDIIPLCKIYVEFSTEYRIIMKKVKPLSSIKKYNTKKMKNVFNYLYYIITENEIILDFKDRRLEKFIDKFRNSGLTKNEIADILDDIHINNLGIDDNNEIVLIDYGL